jgi:hypothetical protein
MNAYGVEWKTDDAVIPELRLYRDAELRQRVPGALSQFEHLTNAIRHLLPAGSGLEWHEWMDDSIRHWCERDIISCWGPSSAGKSAIWGLLAYIDLLADTFVDLRNFPIRNGIEYQFQNMSFFQNSVDSLVGEDPYGDLRNRKQKHNRTHNHNHKHKTQSQAQSQSQIARSIGSTSTHTRTSARAITNV